MEGGKIKIHMKSGWVFGDTALLFQSPRSASIVASTPIELWAMDRRTFHKVSLCAATSVLLECIAWPLCDTIMVVRIHTAWSRCDTSL